LNEVLAQLIYIIELSKNLPSFQRILAKGGAIVNSPLKVELAISQFIGRDLGRMFEKNLTK
jgi:hypothetical protein